jgi:flagellar FliL protein
MVDEAIGESAKVPEATVAAAGVSKSKRLIIIIVVAAVVLLGGIVGGVLLMRSHSTDEKSEDATPEKAAKTAKTAKVTKAQMPKGPPIYTELEPPLIVNFEHQNTVRFLQVTLQIMTRDPATSELIKLNDPIIRNDLLLLLGDQPYSAISTTEGKEKLRASTLDTVRRIVSKEGGKAPFVEAVYFTSFVMQ